LFCPRRSLSQEEVWFKKYVAFILFILRVDVLNEGYAGN